MGILSIQMCTPPSHTENISKMALAFVKVKAMFVMPLFHARHMNPPYIAI